MMKAGFTESRPTYRSARFYLPNYRHGLLSGLARGMVPHKSYAANVSDNQAAVDLLKGKVPKLKKIAADLGYKKAFCTYA